MTEPGTNAEHEWIEEEDAEKIFPVSPRSEFSKLPASMRRKIKALKRNLLEVAVLDRKLAIESFNLQCKYQKEHYDELYAKRYSIISGIYQPTEEECQSPSEENYTSEEEDPDTSQPDGIPNFWLTVFKNAPLLSKLLHKEDELIITHLEDIKIVYNIEELFFTVEFHFFPNDYFTNSILTKTYFLKCDVTQYDPVFSKGLEIYKSEGCCINWNDGMDITLTTLETPRKDRSGLVYSVNETMKNQSFFNFFNPPDYMIGKYATEEAVDDSYQNIIAHDFLLGHYFKDKIVPGAIVFFCEPALGDQLASKSSSETESETKSKVSSSCKNTCQKKFCIGSYFAIFMSIAFAIFVYFFIKNIINKF